MAKDYTEFLERIKEDHAFAEELKKTIERIAKGEKLSDERELLVKAGNELGYEFTMSDIERNFADDQELDDKELAKAAGGDDDDLSWLAWCWGDSSFLCIASVNSIVDAPI